MAGGAHQVVPVLAAGFDLTEGRGGKSDSEAREDGNSRRSAASSRRRGVISEGTTTAFLRTAAGSPLTAPRANGDERCGG